MNTVNANINYNGSINPKCVKCFLKTYERLFKKFSIDFNKQESFISFYWDTMNNSKNLSSPEIQKILHNKFTDLLGIRDPFAEEKKLNNQKALELYSEWRPKVEISISPFDLALRLAIAGNIMDYGANNIFDINYTINTVINSIFNIDHSRMLFNSIQMANKILYLADNAGEIVFDKLFIESLKINNIVYAVKEAPIINDATMNDAKEVGLDKIVKVISNGYDAPSTVLKKCSNEFLSYYNSADLIISKGQGNLEGLINENDNRIFFLLMVKCDVIADILKVAKGSFIVYNKFIRI